MLSGKGLPTAGSVGYEIFDDANALATLAPAMILVRSDMALTD